MKKINDSYDILTLAAKMSKLYYQKPLILSYSGGKDSDVLVQLAIECLDVNDFEILNSHTTVDAPETVYYIRERFEEWRNKGIKCTVLYPKYKDGSPKTMWNLIVKKGIPPTRISRYCCAELKECSTPNRFVALGVRESESAGRRGRNVFATRGATKKDAHYYYYYYSHVKDVFEDSERERERENAAPNDYSVYDCKFIETAKQKKDLMCMPIYKWEDTDIWSYIHERCKRYNPLYDCGDTRVGCIGCPMTHKQQQQLERYPAYKNNYILAFDRMVKKRKADGKGNDKWKDGKAVYKWWIHDETIDGQLAFDENGNIFEE